jgi:hypothetical protein
MLDDISLSIHSSSFAFSNSLHILFSPAGMPCSKKSKSNKIWPANSSHSEVPPEQRPAPQPGIQYVESHRFYEDPWGNSTSQQHVSIRPVPNCWGSHSEVPPRPAPQPGIHNNCSQNLTEIAKQLPYNFYNCTPPHYHNPPPPPGVNPFYYNSSHPSHHA